MSDDMAFGGGQVAMRAEWQNWRDMIQDSLTPSIDGFINRWYPSASPNSNLSRADVLWQLKFVFVVGSGVPEEVEDHLITIIRKHQLTMLKPNEVLEINDFLNKYGDQGDPQPNNEALAVLRCSDGNILIRKKVLERMQIGQART